MFTILYLERERIIGRLFIGSDPDHFFNEDRTGIYIMQNIMGVGGVKEADKREKIIRGKKNGRKLHKKGGRGNFFRNAKYSYTPSRCGLS